jgi:phenylalanyl-tRNA synthetase beta chain
MNTSVAWLNDYLDPPATAQEQADLLTRAGFPLENREEVRLPDGTIDFRQDIELTSNRGDCLCHIGLAREVAAASGRKIKLPRPANTASGPQASALVRVTNREKGRCPLYTARVVRGVKVGPSPKWLAHRLLARGDIPRNAIVDASNFVLFELGQPTHVFDLAKLRGQPPEVIVRRARDKEPFLPIGEGAAEMRLSADDLVIADAERAVAIAGVKGGALTAVTEATTDILIEAATFDPVAVRNTSRRHGIFSDSSYRFERGVHPGQIGAAAERLVELILELCGGTLCQGGLAEGAPIPAPREVAMRCTRCRAILGVAVSDQQMVEFLSRLGFEPRLKAGVIECTAPAPRIDIEREIDLIEEVGRMLGLDKIPIGETISVRIAPPQPVELARLAVNDALVGMDFVESVTHSLISERQASLFLPPGMELLRVADERAKAEPVLRPSILPSLLRVFALNRDNGVRDIRLFETASTFARVNGERVERMNLAFVHPATSPEADPDADVRLARGVIDRLVQVVLGNSATLEVQAETRLPWFAPGAAVRIDGQVLGMFGAISRPTLTAYGIDRALFGAEIGLPEHYSKYPPQLEARALPSFPAIERDVSAIVDERLRWVDVKGAIETLRLHHLEAIDFVTTFRGKQIGPGRKSLTLRTRFRAADRTLKHDEVDPQMDAVRSALRSKFAAEIRT